MKHNMKKTLLILGTIALGFSSCDQFKSAEGGMQYKIHTDQDGPTIKPGDFVALKFMYKTDGDSVIYNSYDFEQATPMYAEQPLFTGDFNTGLGLLSEGDSATIKVSVDSIKALAKRKLSQQPTIKGKHIIYNVKIVKVIPKDTANAAAFESKVQTFFAAETDRVRNNENQRITNYITSKGLKPTVTASGLNYVITKQGTGPKAAVGDTVDFNYTVSLFSGTVFDTSLPALSKKSSQYDPARPYEPARSVAGTGETIPGFDEALLMLPVGTTATLIVPSKLAYADRGGALPPFTPLAFELEILKVTPGKGGAPAAQLPPGQ
jgi:FKBP-type peptidyl-prolyl cis-trans isomerase FkpA